MSTDFETYFEQNAVDGVLPEDAMARLLVGDMGETATAEAGETPEPAPAEEQEPEQQPASDPEGEGKPDEQAADEVPVILAKDGKNTIPYDKLIEARDEAKAAKAANQALMQEMESIKAQIEAMNKPAEEKPPQTPVVDLEDLEQQYQEALDEADSAKALQLRGQINAELKRIAKAEAVSEFEALQSERQRAAEAKSAQQLLDDAAVDIAKQYPELDMAGEAADKEKIAEVVEYRDFLISSKGIPAHEALKKSALRVMGEPKSKEQKQTESDISAQGKAAQVKEPQVKQRTPTTMSDIPAGTVPHHDELEAMSQMSNTAMLGKFMSMDPAKIMETIGRLV